MSAGPGIDMADENPGKAFVKMARQLLLKKYITDEAFFDAYAAYHLIAEPSWYQRFLAIDICTKKKASLPVESHQELDRCDPSAPLLDGSHSASQK